MNSVRNRSIVLALGLLSVLLSACTSALPLVAESWYAVATLEATGPVQPVEEVIAVATATATATPQPAPTATQTPSAPTLLTHGVSNVRRGPGLAYGVSHTLAGGARAAILGRNADASWLAIAGPGNGSGPAGWIASWIVTVSGDMSRVPVLAAPPLPTSTPAPLLPPTPTAVAEVPVHIDPGSPPSTACVAVNPNPGTFVNVHLGPGPQFGLAALLGNWAEVVNSTLGWHQVLLGPGITGWVDGVNVHLVGPC